MNGFVQWWGTIRGKGGLTVVMLSAVDGPPGPSVVAVHGLGGIIHGCPRGPGDRLWGDHWLCDNTQTYIQLHRRN